MSPKALRIAIAEACGWEFRQYEGGAGTIHFGWFDPSGKFRHWSNQTGEKDCPDCLPDYLNDLNAMHEACKTLTEQQELVFRGHLHTITRRDYESGERSQILSTINATAAQRAEALYATLTSEINL